MSSSSEHIESSLESSVAKKYRLQGFDVVIRPQATELPFDLYLQSRPNRKNTTQRELHHCS